MTFPQAAWPFLNFVRLLRIHGFRRKKAAVDATVSLSYMAAV